MPDRGGAKMRYVAARRTGGVSRYTLPVQRMAIRLDSGILEERYEMMRAGSWAVQGVLMGSVVIVALFLFASRRTIEVYAPETEERPSPRAFGNTGRSPEPERYPFVKPLAHPPRVVKAVYATSWTAGSESRIRPLIDLIQRTELNAIVIDIKDVSGFVAYATDLPLPVRYQAIERRIRNLPALLDRLHREGIYAIGRIAVFEDQRLAKARPDLALMNRESGELWSDYKGLHWIDVAAEEAWSYNAAIARDALARGFDEINFDYVRFVSDGALENIRYPFWNASTTSKAAAIERFARYMRRELPGASLSADIFGLSIVDPGDLGIGQQFERIAPHFGAVAPMMYPSHYSAGLFGYRNPAAFPYEIVLQSMERALIRARWLRGRADDAASTTPHASLAMPRIRPWLQDFDLGAEYDVRSVRGEIEAVYDAFLPPGARSRGGSATSTGERISFSCDERKIESEFFGGWMLWNPENVYTGAALCLEPISKLPPAREKF